MYVLAINHDVANYETWKTVFDTFPPARGGASFHRVNRNVENPKNVTVVAGFETAEAVQQFRDDLELKQAMSEAGLTSAPRFEVFEEVEAIQY